MQLDPLRSKTDIPTKIYAMCVWRTAAVAFVGAVGVNRWPAICPDLLLGKRRQAIEQVKNLNMSMIPGTKVPSEALSGWVKGVAKLSFAPTCIAVAGRCEQHSQK